MNKLMAAFTVALVTASVLVAIMLGSVVSSTGKVKKQAADWTDTHLPPLLKSWSSADFRPMLAKEFLRQNTSQEIDSVLGKLKNLLGPLRTYKSSKVAAVSAGSMSDRKEGVFAELDVEAEFEKRRASLDLVLVREEGTWRIAKILARDPE